MSKLQYNLCFIRKGDRLLMLNRNRAPSCGLWQGVGGKLEAGETPYESMLREVYEETGIVLEYARFAGVVTWKVDEQDIGGMYVYVAELPQTNAEDTVQAPLETAEGILAWKGIDWLTQPDNEGVPLHVRQFLKPVLESGQCRDYLCLFREGRLLSCESQLLDDCYLKDAEHRNAG